MENVVDIIEAARDPLALGQHGGAAGLPHRARDRRGRAARRDARRLRRRGHRSLGCSTNNHAIAKSTPPENNQQILAACDRTYTPADQNLRAEPARAREAAERALRLEASVNGARDGWESSR